MKRRFYICLEFDFKDDSTFLSDRAAECLDVFIKKLEKREDPAFSICYFASEECTTTSLMTFDDDEHFEHTYEFIKAALARHAEST